MKKFNFSEVSTTDKKIDKKDIERATKNTKNNDFLIEVAKRLVDK